LTIKETLIFQNLNKLRQQGELLIGYFWCPEYKKEELKQNLEKLRKTAENFNGVSIKKVHTDSTKPTHFQLNDFTRPF
jgi:vacuolar-type H+-ATPase subunit I/STV1